MKVAVFSDIHGNLEALEAFVEDAAGRQVDDYVCLGDVVGYGGAPNECADIVRELAEGGVRIHPIIKIKLNRLANRLNHRDHRKIIIVDGHTGFVGGDQYFRQVRQFHRYRPVLAGYACKVYRAGGHEPAAALPRQGRGLRRRP